MERIKRRETNVFQEALEKTLIMVVAHWQPHKPEVVKANFSKVLADTPLTEEDIFQYTKELVAEGAMSADQVSTIHQLIGELKQEKYGQGDIVSF